MRPSTRSSQWTVAGAVSLVSASISSSMRSSSIRAGDRTRGTLSRGARLGLFREPADQLGERGDALEVLLRQLRVRDPDAPLRLDPAHELAERERVDDAQLEHR